MNTLPLIKRAISYSLSDTDFNPTIPGFRHFIIRWHEWLTFATPGNFDNFLFDPGTDQQLANR
jgi:hypothetical protein